MPITWHELGPAPISAPLNDDDAIHRIADDPTFQASIHKHDGNDLLVVVNDPMRATPTHVALRAIDRVIAKRPRYSLLIATGTHHFDATVRAAFERELTRNLAHQPRQVLWHDADAPNLVAIGAARYHPALSTHKHLLVVGSVEPHYFAGLTGPHKTLTIGCMARADVERNHAGAMDDRAQPMQLDNNPVAQGVAGFVRALEEAGKRILSVSLVAQADTIADIAIGRPLDVVSKLRDSAARVFVRTVAAPADILHLHVEGPLARTLYQADKAIKNNSAAVRDGGTIVLDADCIDGVGPDAFLTLLRETSTYADALALVKSRGYRLGDHKAVRILALQDRSRRAVCITVVSKHLRDEVLNGTRIERFADVDAAMKDACRTQPANPLTGLRIRDAGNVVVIPKRNPGFNGATPQ